LGAKVQVLKKGLFFPIRANKLYELYRNHESIEDLDDKTKDQLQIKYFGRTFGEVYEEVKKYHNSEKIAYAEKNPKNKMALIFKWYFGYATKNALIGSEENIIDYQIYAGPALGAFNEYVRGTELENWKNRHVDSIALKVMEDTRNYILSLKNKNILGGIYDEGRD
jgi:trans-AT polyketide synthase, acyltransferase and oxidoreductase domains